MPLGQMNERTFKMREVRTDKDICEFYNTYAEHWSNRFGFNKSSVHFFQYRLNVLNRMLDLKGNELILDVGCGDGAILKALTTRCKSCVGIDAAEKMIDVARRNVDAGLQNIDFRVDDVYILETCQSNYFDVVYFTGLIEHLQRPISALRSMLRVLKTGGRLIGITPNARSPWYRINHLFRGAKRHLSTDRFYTKDEIYNMLVKSSFRVDIIDCWGFVPGGIPNIFYLPLRLAEAIFERYFIREYGGGIAFRAFKS